MKTDVITVYSDLSGHEAAAEAAEKFCEYNRIAGKPAMHIRLLTEETISMVHGIFDDFKGSFWLESEPAENGIVCRICISVPKAADCEQEMQLIDISSSGKNLNAKGLMGKIREIVRLSVQPAPQKARNSNAKLVDAWWNLGVGSSQADNKAGMIWSLQKYREKLSAETENVKAEWDELEKSIVANIADDVKVWLRQSSTDVMIEKLVAAG